MRFTIRLLGDEILDIELDPRREPPNPPSTNGPPFGFSGGSPVLHTERAWEQADPYRVEG